MKLSLSKLWSSETWWARFTNVFLPAIQIRWKLRLAITPLLAIRSQQIFAHATTAQLSCHVQKFCSDHCIRIEVRVKRNFHRIWIAMEKPLVKRPGSHNALNKSGKAPHVKSTEMLGNGFHLNRSLYLITSSYFGTAHIKSPSINFLNASCHMWGLLFLSNNWHSYISFTECLCQEIKLSSHVVSVVIGTRVCSVARLPLATVTPRFEQWKVVDTCAIVKWRM